MADKIVPSGEYRGFRSTGIALTAQRAVYIPIPKVACTSLKTAFAEASCLAGDVHYEVEWPEVPLEELEKGHDGVFVFAFVRNPWDRLLSCFRSKIIPGRDDYFYRDGVEHNFWKYGEMFHGGMSFDAFVRATASIPDGEADIHFSSQYRHLTGADKSLFVDFVGRFESLNQEFESVCRQIGLQGLDLPYLYRTDHVHYSQYYTAEARRLVEQRWAEDIHTFAYGFEAK